MNYIGVESPEIAKERIKIRVSKGGHGIPDTDVERRYYESLKNLQRVIDICDEINVYDNTEMFKEIVNIKKIKKLDTSLTGTICMYLEGEKMTYVSRRYVSKIKKVLGI